MKHELHGREVTRTLRNLYIIFMHLIINSIAMEKKYFQ